MSKNLKLHGEPCGDLREEHFRKREQTARAKALGLNSKETSVVREE